MSAKEALLPTKCIFTANALSKGANAQ